MRCEVMGMRDILLLRRLRSPVAGVLHDNSGAVAILLAVALSGLVGFAGLGSEVASWYYIKRHMQGAADTAAATAAAELAAATKIGSTATSTQLTNEGRSIAASNNFADGTNSTIVTVNNPPATTANLSTCSSPFSAFNCYVEVLISQPQTPQLLSLFMSTGPTIQARAVALANISAADNGCVLALDRNSDIGLTTSGSPSLTFNSCALYVNSPLKPGAVSMNGNPSISAQSAYIVGTVSGSGLTATDGIYTGVNPIADPYAGVSVPWPSLKPNASTGANCDQNNFSGSGTISASSSRAYVFCNGIKITGNSTLNLCPGVYIVDQGSVDLHSGTLNAPPSSGCANTGGVTIILANDTGGLPPDITVNGNFNLKITAPTSGSTAGIALFQDRVSCPGCGNKINGGSTSDITGAIYFPTNAVSYSGGSSTGGAVCTQLIAYTITFKGNSTFNSNCGSAGTKTINTTNGTLVM
jgi:Flp pilus assembly protein TadG